MAARLVVALFAARARRRSVLAALAVIALCAVPAIAELQGTPEAEAPVGFDRDATLSAVAGALGDESATPEAPVPPEDASALSAAEAQDLAEEQFGDELETPERALELPQGADIERYLGDFSAQVRLEGGERRVALSALPLRAEDETGRLAPVRVMVGLRGERGRPPHPRCTGACAAWAYERGPWRAACRRCRRHRLSRSRGRRTAGRTLLDTSGSQDPEQSAR